MFKCLDIRDLKDELWCFSQVLLLVEMSLSLSTLYTQILGQISYDAIALRELISNKQFTKATSWRELLAECSRGCVGKNQVSVFVLEKAHFRVRRNRIGYIETIFLARKIQQEL